MTKRRPASRPQAQSVFNYGTLINVLTIPVLSAIFALAGFYFKMGDIPARLDKETEQRQTAFKEENSAREQLRSALLTFADKTSHSIDSLAANQMVTQEHIKSLDTTLDHVVTGLQNIESAVNKVKK